MRGRVPAYLTTMRRLGRPGGDARESAGAVREPGPGGRRQLRQPGPGGRRQLLGNARLYALPPTKPISLAVVIRAPMLRSIISSAAEASWGWMEATASFGTVTSRWRMCASRAE